MSETKPLIPAEGIPVTVFVTSCGNCPYCWSYRQCAHPSIEMDKSDLTNDKLEIPSWCPLLLDLQEGNNAS